MANHFSLRYLPLFGVSTSTIRSIQVFDSFFSQSNGTSPYYVISISLNAIIGIPLTPDVLSFRRRLSLTAASIRRSLLDSSCTQRISLQAPNATNTFVVNAASPSAACITIPVLPSSILLSSIDSAIAGTSQTSISMAVRCF